MKENTETREILHAYLQVTRHMSRRFRRYFGQLDLTFPQALVLTALREEGEMPISRLADFTGSANSTVSGIVDRLERLGMVKRERSDSDRRVIYVDLTEKYHTIMKETQPDVEECLADVMEVLSAGDLKQIIDSFRLLEHALEETHNEK